MSATVLLKDIVDALEMVSDELPSFLDLDSGEVETVHRELLGLAEECGDDEERLESALVCVRTLSGVVSSGHGRNALTCRPPKPVIRSLTFA